MSELIFSDELPRIDWSEVKRFDTGYGMKAATSLALPRAWTLPFVLVPVAVASQVGSSEDRKSVV